MLHADALRARKIVEAMQQGSVIEVNAEIAIQAAELSLRTKLPMADSLIYTTAVLSHAALWTQDEHFKGLPSVRYFSKVRSMKS